MVPMFSDHPWCIYAWAIAGTEEEGQDLVADI